MKPTRTILVVLFLVALTSIAAAIPSRPLVEPKAEPKAESHPETPPDWTKTRIPFHVVDKPWREVLKWFAQKANMPLVHAERSPASTFTYVPPLDPVTGIPVEHTLVEILDVLNDSLQRDHERWLVRDGRLVLYVTADGLFDIPIPKVKLADLRDRGRTEIVQVVILVRAGMDAQEVAPDIKRLLGPHGRVVPLPDTNELVIQGRGDALRRLVPLYASLD